MRARVGRLLLPCVVAAASLAPRASGQDAASLEAALQAARSKQRFLISGSLELSAAESQKFWPAFERYEAGLAKLDARSARLLAEFIAAAPAPPAATATAMVEEHLGIEAERLGLLKAHVAEVRKLLPPTTLVRYVQLRNKLDLAIRWDLAQRIPLAVQ